jgi:two-component system NtrC family sensor kinase
LAFRWRIRLKLMLGLALVVGIMALLLGGTLKGLLSYRETTKAIQSKNEEAKAASQFWESVKRIGQPGPPGNELADLNQKIAEAEKNLEKYEEKLKETIDKGRDLDHGYNERSQVEALNKEFADLATAVNKAQDPQVNIDGTSVPLVKEPAVERRISELTDTAGNLVSVIYETIGYRAERGRHDFNVSMWFVLSTCGIGVMLLTWLLRFFYAWVFYPVRDLQEGAGRVARGDFERRIEVHSGDEMEDLAAAFNDMTGRLREMYADMARQINERSRQLVRSERLAGVGFLAAGVAHEINNPLASIAFCSEALEQRLTDMLAAARRHGPGHNEQDAETIAKYLKMIQEEAFRCKEITQRLLEFSRGGERRRESADLGEIIQGVFDVVQHLQSCRGKHLDFQASGPLVALVNAQEIKSVVLNLVVNALDSMEEGGTLTVTLGQRDGLAEMVFKDTGCGMSAEVLENIFEPFFTRSRTGKGTGLGLSISHRIINQHGGEIEAASPGPGQGSTFTVRLPLRPVEATPDNRDQAPEEADPELFFKDRRGEPGKRRAA